MTDLVIRGGTVVSAAERRLADVAVEDGRIVDIGPDLPGAREEIDARGLFVMPGVIDVHLHFNEPGRTEWEGAATGSRALAAGGGTVFFDMPLNSTPCTVNAREVERKRAALEASSVADFGLWGGLVPGGVGDMAEMAAHGVVGFKAFMCHSGLPEFPYADDKTLADGLKEAARIGLPVSVHAESEAITQALAAQITGRDVRDFLNSRPVAAELDAIERALVLAGAAGAKLHIVHVSSGRGVATAFEAKARGVDVSIETCPHYLFFTEDDVERLGAVAKCAPPLRPSPDQNGLWVELLAGHVDIIASDHSPAPPSMKSGDGIDFKSAWGGIAGVQTLLSVLLGAGHHARGLPLERIVSLTASTPARRFRIAGKGELSAGADADLVLVDVGETFTVKEADLEQRHKMTPYLGAVLRGRARRTIRRGETIFADGRSVSKTQGRFVRPS